MTRSNRRLFPRLVQKESTAATGSRHHLHASAETYDLPHDEAPDDDVDLETTSANEPTNLVSKLRTVSNELLCFLGASCFARSTDADFKRFLTSQNDLQLSRDAEDLWKNVYTKTTSHFFCNTCGKEGASNLKCCGIIVKYHRLGGYEQLCAVVEEHFEAIAYIRKELSVGRLPQHNLNGSFLRKMKDCEEENRWNLSLLASIDGVSLNGNTKKKLWPVTLNIVDLETAEMQKASNMILHGIAEGDVNPSVHFWNSVVPMVYTDTEQKTFTTRGVETQFCLISWTGDQPAKRALFGFKSHSSEGSCFFGVCHGTHHKTMSHARYIVREGHLTDEDAKNAQNGFGNTYPKVLDYCYPYDTIVDLLHNGTEGLFQLIMNEALADNERRSDLFENDYSLFSELCNKSNSPAQFRVRDMRNGTEKLTFFRINFGLAALVNPSLKPMARLTIVSLMLVVNQMYTNAPHSDLFFVHLTAVARWALAQSSIRYMTMKSHELVAHLPFALSQFGNIAPLSTFSYEHFYKHFLKGFNAQKTKGFVDSAIARLLLSTAVKREIKRRNKECPSVPISNFIRCTPSLQAPKTTWKHKIAMLDDEDGVSDGYTYFSTLQLPLGRMQSANKKNRTSNDVFFAETVHNVHACYIFIAVAVKEEEATVLARRIRAVPPLEEFRVLQDIANNMDRPGNTYGFNLLTHCRRYNGLVHGKLTEEKEMIPISSIRGLGSSLCNGSNTYYLQVNGACVHH